MNLIPSEMFTREEREMEVRRRVEEERKQLCVRPEMETIALFSKAPFCTFSGFGNGGMIEIDPKYLRICLGVSKKQFETLIRVTRAMH